MKEHKRPPLVSFVLLLTTAADWLKAGRDLVTIWCTMSLATARYKECAACLVHIGRVRRILVSARFVPGFTAIKGESVPFNHKLPFTSEPCRHVGQFVLSFVHLR